MQDETRRGNQAVTAFFLNTRQSTEKLVGDVLSQTGFAEPPSRNFEDLRLRQWRFAVRSKTAEPEPSDVGIVDFSQVMPDALDHQPVSVRGNHFPRGEVVHRRAPQHRFLATRVHGDVAANTRSVSRGRINREHEPGSFCRLHGPAGNDPCTAIDGGHLLIEARQTQVFNTAEAIELLCIDHRRKTGQRHGATSVTGATAARNDGQSQIDAGPDQTRHLRFSVRIQHDERIFDSPVGRVSYV